ncbi:hypothetical protein AJ80_05209 [Polytolypa hystricis UAMH7299]|uniref:Nineteen complex-related protein 2-domain-containing protein n=1 Tax=Polytolypa hystricis (strain UAMH7299) TaxID=1447883 RepID=A0A2B7Y5F9_POLH7|nr:hypothetical protein AJ80_05209 [Polytolypa hystricis UAMH7299]
MSTVFFKRRKARKIGAEEEDDSQTSSGPAQLIYEDSEPVIRKPTSKPKQRSKLRLSFDPGEASVADDDRDDSVVITPKRGLGARKNIVGRSGLQRSWTASSDDIPVRSADEGGRPLYNQDYLKELRDSTPSTPKDVGSVQASDDEGGKDLDIAGKFGELAEVYSMPSIIPSQAEIREKKERRARLAKEQDFISLDVEEDEEEEWRLSKKEERLDTRLIRDDEDFAEGFDEFIEDERIALGRKAEKEQLRRHRAEMKDLIDEAEDLSEEDDSEAERKAAYEASQTRAAMDGMSKAHKQLPSRPKTPPKISSLPRLANHLLRLRSSLSAMESSKAQLVHRMEDLRKEKEEIRVREGEIQTLLKEAGDNYERLKAEAGLSQEQVAALPGTNLQNQRGLEDLGTVSEAPSDRLQIDLVLTYRLLFPKPAVHCPLSWHKASLFMTSCSMYIQAILDASLIDVCATMIHQFFLSFTRESTPDYFNSKSPHPRRCVPWIQDPLIRSSGVPRLYRHRDATPIELFFDLFFVANLSTFTATHEINNLEALWSYVGFLSIIWFTWLQVTLFDIRFARDSIFERTCKALQLATMVGFASVGSGFSTRVHDDNVWTFRALSVILAASRLMLSVQYFIAAAFLWREMQLASRRLQFIALIVLGTSVTYTGLYFAFHDQTDTRGPYVWTAWYLLFAVETLAVMLVSCRTPGIGLEDTHLNVRMGLLTLIIIGEGVISITRIVNMTVGNGGWTKWSFVHILGVTTAVYLLWQSYFDIAPRARYGNLRQQIWAQLHFPFHVSLILLSEASQILALTLDVSLKLKYLSETIIFACEPPRPDPTTAIDLLNSTIRDMEIHYDRGALEEKRAIEDILQALRDNPPLCSTDTLPGALNLERSHHLMGNVTASLFASKGIMPAVDNPGSLEGTTLLMMYLKLLAFVYVYYFVVASFVMFFLAIFMYITHQRPLKAYTWIAIATRIFLGVLFLCLIGLTSNFEMTYRFMTSPMIIFTFTLALFTSK